ncbi:MAG: hypothetical protein SFW67_28680 [Myxococcaceae bacterium]|nr:hypothetical protein [Myxococcaceae bacterium]
MSTDATRPRLKWARSQRFRLTVKGEEGLRAWKSRLAEVQGQGKGAFDTAQAEWAKGLGITPDDTPTITELAATPLRVEDVEKSFADLGLSRQAVKDSLSRLYDAGLVEPAV